MIKLPHIDTIAKETMRLHPVAPLLVPRLCREDIQIGGYECLDVSSIGRHRIVWKDPNKFCPDRFINIGKPIDIKGQNFGLLPFGSGRKMCQGW